MPHFLCTGLCKGIMPLRWRTGFTLRAARREDESSRFVQKTAENYQISVTSVKRYLKECLEERILEESGEARCGYRLTSVSRQWSYENAGGLLEDRGYLEDIYPQPEDVSQEAERIWSYAFMVMMNNAIEHSKGTED